MHKADNNVADGEDERVDIADPFARRLLVRYLGRREADLESLRTALAGSDFETIRITGHKHATLEWFGCRYEIA